jgi:hypothetical protein
MAAPDDFSKLVYDLEVEEGFRCVPLVQIK